MNIRTRSIIGPVAFTSSIWQKVTKLTFNASSITKRSIREVLFISGVLFIRSVIEVKFIGGIGFISGACNVCGVCGICIISGVFYLFVLKPSQGSTFRIFLITCWILSNLICVRIYCIMGFIRVLLSIVLRCTPCLAVSVFALLGSRIKYIIIQAFIAIFHCSIITHLAIFNQATLALIYGTISLKRSFRTFIKTLVFIFKPLNFTITLFALVFIWSRASFTARSTIRT